MRCLPPTTTRIGVPLRVKGANSVVRELQCNLGRAVQELQYRRKTTVQKLYPALRKSAKLTPQIAVQIPHLF